MIKPRDLNMEHPYPVQMLLQLNDKYIDGVHPVVYEATDPEDIWQRQVREDIGVKVFLEHTTNRWYLIGWGLRERNTTRSGMGLETKPKEALIIYCPLQPDQIKLQEEKVSRLKNYRPGGGNG